MLPALRDGPEPPSARPIGDSDDGWGRGPRRRRSPPDRPRGGLPLPDAGQSRVRLRDHRPLADQLPRPRAPARPRARAPRRSASAPGAASTAPGSRAPVLIRCADLEQLDVQPADHVARPADPDALDDRQRGAGPPRHARGPERARPSENPADGFELDDRAPVPARRSAAASAATLARQSGLGAAARRSARPSRRGRPRPRPAPAR